MESFFFQLYCVFVVSLFYRYISDEITQNNRKGSYRPRMYDEFEKDNYHLNNYLPGKHSFSFSFIEKYRKLVVKVSRNIEMNSISRRD